MREKRLWLQQKEGALNFLTVVISFIGSFAVGSAASGQTALFIYNNGTGTPAVGAYYPGQSFTF